MAGESKVTRDHDEIRRWIEERGGRPAGVIGTGGKGDPGMIRVDFPGFSGEGSLQELSWDDFFKAFDDGIAHDTQETIDEAKRLCGLCRFRRDCLQGALDRREACGVWGGELLRDGAVVMFRPRGRPRTQRVVQPV